MNIGVILAGGVGNRLGAGIPKQFIEIQGKPIIAYTLDIFEKCQCIDYIEIVCVPSYINYMNNLIKKFNYKKIKWVTEGGDTFQESVYKGVINLKNELSDDDIVAIHFSASPFVNDEIIEDSIRVAKEKGNAISTTDFILLPGIKDDNFKTTKYINRDTIACMSTPHTFNYKFIMDMYKEAIESGVINEVEPHTTTLMYKMGLPIYFSKGSQTNIKITRKEDLDLFEGWVLLNKKREE